jgi:hypothetical protein
MTNPYESGCFVEGLLICHKYCNCISITLTGNSTITVEGLAPLSEKDLQQLYKLGWHGGNKGDGASLTYSKLLRAPEDTL